MSKSLKQNLFLLRTLSFYDFKVRYSGSVLGYFWSLLKPFLLFVILYFVFSSFTNFEVENYALYLLLGIIIWNFFSEATNAGMNSLLAKSGIIKKIYFPRIFVVLSSLFAAVFTLVMNLIIFVLVAFLSGVEIGMSIFFLLYAIGLLAVFVLSTGLILAILQTHFRDTVQVWEVLLSAGFFVTPIFYPLSIVSSKFSFLLQNNPLSIIIDLARYPFFTEMKIDYSQIFTFSVFCIIYLLLSITIFNYFESKVIEEL
jgi:ABC-type polysaccharide/polyol phosphate export permease